MILDKIFLNNTVEKWGIALLVFAAVLLVLRFVKGLVFKRLDKIAQKTANEVDDLAASLVDEIKFFFLFFVAIYAGQFFLVLPVSISTIVGKIVIIALLLQGAVWGTAIITFWINRYKKRKMEVDAASVTTFTALSFVLRLVLWAIILLLALDNLGVDITTLVAGLGVGGIAVALAVQNILGDLFASLSIVLDKPFVIGDFIIIDNYMGTIEHIGLKTTRIRSLSGEQLVFSNTDLLKSRIRNYKRMYERRVVFSLGVIYQTSLEKLEKISGMLKEIVEQQEKVRFDRAHFKEYGASSLNYEIVYWVKSPDYNVYMDIQQAINLEIYRRFSDEQIEFAYPTQTLFINREETAENKSVKLNRDNQ